MRPLNQKAVFARLDRATRLFVPVSLPALACRGSDGRGCLGIRCLACPGHGFVPSPRSGS